MQIEEIKKPCGDFSLWLPGERVQEFGMDVYTLLYLKWM